MRAKTLQIIWHSSQPVLSLDFHVPTSLLATGGADNDIKLWSLSQQDPRVFFEANLSYHSAAVNVVRFSPSGQELASGADGGELLLWRPVQSNDNTPLWKVIKTLRFHPKDVLDLEWSPDGALLASGSVDNSCIIWDIMKGIPLQILTDHLHYVQGVAWDPTGQYLASISCDRTCRIYSCKSASSKSKGQEKKTFTCQHILVKTEAGALDTTEKLIEDGSMAKAAPLKYHLFHDENMPSFFRRLAWSPDGSFLLIPAGIYKHTAEANSLNTAYILSRKDLSRPSLQLPGASKPIVAVRFCPLLFKHVSPSGAINEGDKIFKLPYRLVFAVATLNSVLIYDTHQLSPVAVLAGIHYAAITDLAWSPDGKQLVVSSQDGFCTLVEFEDGDLGQIMPLSDAPHHVAEHMPACWLSKAGVCVDENLQKCSEGYEAGIEANSNSHLSPSNVEIDMGKNVHPNDGLVSSIGSAEQHTPEREKSSFAGHCAPSQNESCMEKIRPLSGQKRRIVPVPIPPELQTEKNL